MKKFLLTAGVLAIASISLFTSCKDEDEPANINTTTIVTPALDDSEIADALAQALKDAAKDGTIQNADGTTTEVVTVVKTDKDDDVIVTTTSTNRDANGNITTVEVSESEYDYTYTVDGVTYNSMEEVQNALRNKPAGSTATVIATLVQTTTTITKDATGQQIGTPTTTTKSTKTETTVTIPEVGKTTTTNVQIPVSVDDPTKTVNNAVTLTTKEVTNNHGGASVSSN